MLPCLQPDFLPFAPWRTAYLSQARQPFRIAVEGSGTVVYETRIRGGSPADLRYLERTIKLLLWSVGGWRVTLQGDGGPDLPAAGEFQPPRLPCL